MPFILNKNFLRNRTQRIYPKDVFETVELTTHISNTRNSDQVPVTTDTTYTVANVRMKKLNRVGKVQDPSHTQTSDENVVFQFFKKDLDNAGVPTPVQIQVGDYLKRSNGDYYVVVEESGLTEQAMGEVLNLNTKRFAPE